jgi:hypothetical protein
MTNEEEEPPRERMWLRFRNEKGKEWNEVTTKSSFNKHSYRRKEDGKRYFYSQKEGYEDRQVVDFGPAPPLRTKRKRG